jgi:DNA repair exonuclease SbcCD ATPase subunit
MAHKALGEISLTTANNLRVEIHALQRENEALKEQLQQANKKCEAMETESLLLQKMNEAKDRELQSTHEDLSASNQSLQDANRTIHDLRESNEDHEQCEEIIRGLRQRNHELEEANEDIEDLQQRYDRLKQTRERLKKELKEARDGHNAVSGALQVMTNMLNARGYGPQAVDMAGRMQSVEATGSNFSGRAKRESVDTGGEGSGMASRASKRIKKEEFIDISD